MLVDGLGLGQAFPEDRIVPDLVLHIPDRCLHGAFGLGMTGEGGPQAESQGGGEGQEVAVVDHVRVLVGDHPGFGVVAHQEGGTPVPQIADGICQHPAALRGALGGDKAGKDVVAGRKGQDHDPALEPAGRGGQLIGVTGEVHLHLLPVGEVLHEVILRHLHVQELKPLPEFPVEVSL